MPRENYSERLRIAAEQNAKEKDFWLKQLSGELVKTCFPYDYIKTGSHLHKTPPDTVPASGLDILIFDCPEKIAAKLIELSKGSDYTLNLLLIAGVILLLNKYSGTQDIMVGTPIYKPEIEGDFINTVLVLRSRVENHAVFKDFLLQVRQTISDAVENQNYPIELLEEKLNVDMETLGEGAPLFDVAVLLENIHDKKYLPQGCCKIIFTFRRETDCIAGMVEYDGAWYEKATIEQMVGRFMNLLQKAIFNINERLSDLDMLTDLEKKQLLHDFNDTKAGYPAGKTIPQWFEEQVEKTPGDPAVCSPVDLGDIFDRLDSDKQVPGTDKRMEAACFKKNPYIHCAHLDLSHRESGWKLLKTHCHNSVIINNNMAELTALFDGKRNLKFIFHCLKNLKAEGVEFIIYSMNKADLLEVSFRFNNQAETFSIGAFEDLVQVVRVLYKSNIIDLVGMADEYVEPGCETLPGGWSKKEEPLRLKSGAICPTPKDETQLNARVLLLGDTPGIPSTGLLYLGSYLRREGIEARCQFYDPSGDYTSMKQNIEEILASVQPGIVAVSLKWFLYTARVIDMCKIVKEYAAKHNLDIKVVVGGNTASYYWKEMITYDCIDYLVRGDGEEPLLKICRGENDENIPNCIYKDKKNGEIVANPITYIQDETITARIYLSHLDELLLSDHASLPGSFFIYTHKGCAMNCFYCGGCSRAQEETFGRQKVFRRGVEEVRKDIMEAKKYTSTFQFDFDIPDANLVDYCKRIWEGIDLSGYFCIFATLLPPSAALIELISHTFKYIYWDFDICTLSERHRKQLYSLGLVKPLPTDDELLGFMARCEQYPNIEVRLNLITGLPYFTIEDIEPGAQLLAKILHTYSCFGELHWARLHAQPGAPVAVEAGKYRMYSYAATFEDFLKYSEKNFNRSSGYVGVESFDYPYIYYNDEHLNSGVTHFYLESNRKIDQFKYDKKRSLIVCDAQSYQQVNERAGCLAGTLVSMGVKPDAIVALMLERSGEIAVGILGILKAGGAYMPIDPEFPPGRIEYMLKDSNASLLVTARHLLTEVGKQVKTWKGEKVLLEEIPKFQKSSTYPLTFSPSNLQSSSNPAYIIYTSGTMGKSKGVAVKHENLVNYVNWFSQKAGLTSQDKTILTTSFAFDLGYTSLYTSLLNGCQLHILPRETYLLAERLLSYIKQKEITYIKVTPSLFSVIVNAPGFSETTCKSLRLAVVGGEAIRVKDIEKAHTNCRHLKIMNHYGPTEATVGCISTIIDFDKFIEYKAHPVIGKPIANAAIYILDKNLNLQSVGIPGELCISGVGVGMGYLNRPELTAEKFVDLHHSSFIIHHLKLYRTGDLARWLPNGTIEFLGRIDTQVKIRGYRVELGEIESRLRKHPQVAEALVVVKETAVPERSAGTEEGEKYLCAYIVSKENEETLLPRVTREGKIEHQKKIVSFQELGIDKYFVEQLEKDREKIAVASNGRYLTFGTLDRYSDRLARISREKYDDRYKLSQQERIRYKRQMLLAGWGQMSQEKLKSTTVFVAGAGGGASPTVTQLALAGFGTIKICDFDSVELSNLNRQFLHDEERLGMNKALSAQITVNKVNPHTKVIPYTQKLTRENVFELVGDSAIIFDMFDGPADKFVLSECAVIKQIPHMIISMTDINAYAAVLHSHHTPCYHCLFDKGKLETIVSGMTHYVENYSKNPLPVVSTSLFISTGVVVNEALKILLGFEKPAYNKFFYFNQRGASGNLVFTPGYKAMTYLFSDHFIRLCKEQEFDWEVGWRGNFLEEFTIEPDPECPVCGPKGVEKRKSLGEQMKRALHVIDIPGGEKTDQKPQTIALLVNHGTHLAVGVVGAIKSGKVLVHLDPASSMEAWVGILEDCEGRVIVTDDQWLSTAEKLRDRVNTNIAIINIDHIEDMEKGGDNPGSMELTVEFRPDQPAYMLYTTRSDRNFEKQNSVMKGLYKALFTRNEYTFGTNKKTPDTGSLLEELRECLREELPDYMIPSHFIPIEKIPLTPNGKVDKKALPGPDSGVIDKSSAPRNKLEEKLAEIWAEVLGIEKNTISIEANFFSLGGHSLNATIMISKIHKELNIKLPLSQVFQTPTIEGLSEYSQGTQQSVYTSIQPLEDKEYYPVSSAQKRMFMLNRLKNETDTSDNTPMVLSVEGNLDKERLKKAVKQLIKRHDTLRTSFELLNDFPVQKVNREVEFEIEYYELPSSAEVKPFIRSFIRSFELNKAPLLRVGLVKQTNNKHILMCDMHHIIMDNISSFIFINEFVNLYEGVKLPQLKVQYKEYASWQNRLLEFGEIKKQEEYWLSVFADEMPSLDLPTDYPRPEVQSFDGDLIYFEFAAPLKKQIDQIAKESGATLYIVLLAIYTLLLSKYTGQEDIVVGIPTAGRPHAEFEYVIGMFVNTLAIRNYPGAEKTFIEFLEEVKANALKAFDNQEYQFEDLVNKLGIKPGSNRNPLFDTMFAGAQGVNITIDAEDSVKKIKDLIFRPYQFEENITQFDIITHVFESGEVISFRLRYCTKLFKPETIVNFSNYFKEIATSIAENKYIRLKDIKISHEFSSSLSRIFKEAESDFEL